MTPRLLAIVPARGGSVGILRKNTRLFNDRPLVLAKLEALRAAGPDWRIVCSTNDPIIASIARVAGFEVHHRGKAVGPEATIADTVTEVVDDLGWVSPVGVFQCTSPGLTPARLTELVEAWLADESLFTAASVVPLHDVAWDNGGQHYGEWVNRQFDAPALWRETGGIRLVRDPALLPTMVDPDGHDLIELTEVEALDIDSHAQLAAASQSTAPIVFMVAVGPTVGSGHIHRCLTLADELAHHEISFHLTHDGEMDLEGRWEELVLAAGYRLTTEDDPPARSVVVLDVLAADPSSVWALRSMLGNLVVCLEDDGPGARLAHAGVNELYAEGAHAGPDYAVLRPEFYTGRPHGPSTRSDADRRAALHAGLGHRVLVYFGGTDPSGAAGRVVDVVRALGLPFNDYTGADGREEVPLSEAMATHDLLITAAGRAVLAGARVGIPTISIPTSAREMDHAQLDSVLYLRRIELATDAEIGEAVMSLMGSPALRREMSERGRMLVDGRGTQRVAAIIESLCEEL